MDPEKKTLFSSKGSKKRTFRQMNMHRKGMVQGKCMFREKITEVKHVSAKDRRKHEFHQIIIEKI